MSQTENPETNSSTSTPPADDGERIRKIFARDLKLGETVHTVFRALQKEKHTSRGGKAFLSLLLVDRTGEVDGRVFENVGPADHAFSNDDYLLVKGKVGTFHGKTQLVIERLERLDPGPIDAAEFAWTPAPPKEAPAAKDDHHAAPAVNKVRLSKRLERLLEHPQLAQALDTFVAHLEKAVLAQHGVKPPEKPERHDKHEPKHERPERKPRGPKVEHKPDVAAAKHEPRRDPNLPEGLAFKPFTALVGQDEKPAEPAPAPTEPPTS